MTKKIDNYLNDKFVDDGIDHETTILIPRYSTAS